MYLICAGLILNVMKNWHMMLGGHLIIFLLSLFIFVAFFFLIRSFPIFILVPILLVFCLILPQVKLEWVRPDFIFDGIPNFIITLIRLPREPRKKGLFLILALFASRTPWVWLDEAFAGFPSDITGL